MCYPNVSEDYSAQLPSAASVIHLLIIDPKIQSESDEWSVRVDFMMS